MSKIVVYWSSGFPSDVSGISPAIGLITRKPKKLSLCLKDCLPLDKKTATYLKCPSIVQEIKKYYTINSPFNYTISWDKNSTYSSQQNQEFFNAFVRIESSHTIFLGLYYTFFCEEDLEITTLPPFLHGENINKDVLVFPATLNIGKWVRAIHPYYLKKKEKGTLTTIEDNPLFYIKFNTDKEIIFKEFEYTDKLDKILANGQKISRGFFPSRRLEYYYNLFNQYRLRGILLKNIKANIIE